MNKVDDGGRGENERFFFDLLRRLLSVVIATGVSTSGHEESEADDRSRDGVEGPSDVSVDGRSGETGTSASRVGA